MAKKKYRVELVYEKRLRNPKCFLVKDVRVRDRKGKVRKYLGTKQPTHQELKNYRTQYAFEIEARAAKKKAELTSSFYTSDYLTKQEIIELEEIKYIYQTLLGLMTTSEIEAYERGFEIHYIQGTTAIEGNTLSIKEAQDLLLFDVLPEDKTLREINEVQNFKKVARYRNSYKGKITLDFIKTLHSLTVANIDNETAGIFRRSDIVGISGCDLRSTPYLLIEEELNHLISRYYDAIKNNKNPFEQGIIFHYEFEIIHPFADGNGRVGREILNFMLNTNKFPKLLFLGKYRENYIKALRFGNKNDYREMIKIFANLIKEQRAKIFRKNLQELVKSTPRTGQLMLTDFGDVN